MKHLYTASRQLSHLLLGLLVESIERLQLLQRATVINIAIVNQASAEALSCTGPQHPY